MSKESHVAEFIRGGESEELVPETLRAIDVKVIKYLRALSSQDMQSAAEILAVSKTSDPVAEFGEAGAAYLRKALDDAKVCFEMLRSPKAVKISGHGQGTTRALEVSVG